MVSGSSDRLSATRICRPRGWSTTMSHHAFATGNSWERLDEAELFELFDCPLSFGCFSRKQGSPWLSTIYSPFPQYLVVGRYGASPYGVFHFQDHLLGLQGLVVGRPALRRDERDEGLGEGARASGYEPVGTGH